jgi:hypothetical protein
MIGEPNKQNGAPRFALGAPYSVLGIKIHVYTNVLSQHYFFLHPQYR